MKTARAAVVEAALALSRLRSDIWGALSARNQSTRLERIGKTVDVKKGSPCALMTKISQTFHAANQRKNATFVTCVDARGGPTVDVRGGPTLLLHPNGS